MLRRITRVAALCICRTDYTRRYSESGSGVCEVLERCY